VEFVAVSDIFGFGGGGVRDLLGDRWRQPQPGRASRVIPPDGGRSVPDGASTFLLPAVLPDAARPSQSANTARRPAGHRISVRPEGSARHVLRAATGLSGRPALTLP
jgi:hypothetical protein